MNTNAQISHYFDAVASNKKELDWELARKRAFHTRSKAIEHLDKHLIDFETHFTRNQGKMYWAPAAENAIADLQLATKGYSTFSVEHRILKEIKFQKPSNWEFIAEDAFPKIDENSCAVLFPDFYISENGALMLHHNLPAFDMLLAKCKKVIYVLGIEQVCPTMHEAENLITLLARQGEGKKEFPAVHISLGNRFGREHIGPIESSVMLIDNGRSNILGEIPQRQALYCIHCGACSKYSNFATHGEAKNAVIDTIKAPFYSGPKHFESNFKLPLSGLATSSCPVAIDLKGLVLENRRLAVEQKMEGRSDALAWKAWKTAMLSRKWLNKGAGMKAFTLKSFFKKHWGEAREFPKPVEQSFNEWWIQTRGKSEN